jgi:D-glycero-D-manno-heptose 1,7-bisphosphate phosphatase
VAKSAVFIDRDGVLNIEAGYIHKKEDFNLLPGVALALRKLNDLGIFCCLVSNQAGPAKGYYPVDRVEALHEYLTKLLHTQAGAKLDAIYYCPYLSPSAGGVEPQLARWSAWRKPNTGMLVAAAWEHDLDLKKSFAIGDEAIDIDMAHNVGAKGILVQTGYGKKVLNNQHQHPVRPDFIATDFADAVEWIGKKIAT